MRDPAECLARARAIVAGQRAAMECAMASGEVGLPADVLEDVEAQFLWGLYSELVARGPAAPANGHDRVVAHLVNHFATVRGLNLDAARDKAHEIEDLFNQAEPLFEAIAERGRLAVSIGGSRHFIEICQALQGVTTEKVDV